MIFISNWARQHIAVARLLITLLHFYVLISTMYLAQLLIGAGFVFSLNQVLPVIITGFCIIVITSFYRKRITDCTIKIRLQKFRFLLMGFCCTLFLIGFFSSQLSSEYTIADNVQAAFTKTEKIEKPAYESYVDKDIFYRDLKAYYSTLSKRELKKELRYQLKKMAHKPSETGTALIILSFIILAAIAISLIAALSCSLACNGQGALALLVFAGGIAGIIVLAAYVGKKLRKERVKRKAEELKTTG